MKKLFMIIMCLITVPALSESITMCVAQNSVNVILDPNIGGTNYTQDATNVRWTTTFSYGVVQGIAACLDTGEGKSMGNTIAEFEEKHPDGVMRPVTGGEKYGRYCWCRLTHPVSSLWAFDYDFGSVSNCASICSIYCGFYVRNNVALRAGLFGSVAPDAN